MIVLVFGCYSISRTNACIVVSIFGRNVVANLDNVCIDRLISTSMSLDITMWLNVT